MAEARIYLDNAATTPIDPRVVESMLPYLGERFGNPSSRTHPYGWEAEEALARAREQVAALFRADPRDVVFTSGATEADNLAIKGVLETADQGAHLVTTAVEHEAVLEPARSLERRGRRVSWVAPDADARIDPQAVAAAIGPGTALVSVIHGNNEVGTLQDLPAIAALCAERGVPLHSDATQSAGKVPIDFAADPISLLSVSAHKLHGPKGAGCLLVRRGRGAPRLRPQLEGGGHERGLRSGTPNVPALVGFGTACELALAAMAEEASRIAELRDRLEAAVLAAVPGARRNGPASPRLPGITNLHFDGLDGESLLLALPRVAFSLGSACASASLEPSHVLRAMGRTETVARNSIRLSLGRFNTVGEVAFVIEELIAAVGRLRADPERPRVEAARRAAERRETSC